MIDNNKDNILSKSIYILIVLGSFLYVDMYGILPLIGSMALLSLLSPEQTHVKKNEFIAEVSVYSKLLFWGSIGGSLMIQVLVQVFELECTVVVGGITVIQNPLLLYYFAVPFVYFVKQKSRMSTNRKNWLAMLIVLSCILYRSVIVAMDASITLDSKGGIVGAIDELIQLFVWAAVMEELFFRGYIFDFAQKCYGPEKAMLLTSIMFLMFHLRLIVKCFENPIPHVLNIVSVVMLGILMNVVYKKYKSIIACILYHALANGFITYIFLIIYG